MATQIEIVVGDVDGGDRQQVPPQVRQTLLDLVIGRDELALGIEPHLRCRRPRCDSWRPDREEHRGPACRLSWRVAPKSERTRTAPYNEADSRPGIRANWTLMAPSFHAAPRTPPGSWNRRGRALPQRSEEQRG